MKVVHFLKQGVLSECSATFALSIKVYTYSGFRHPLKALARLAFKEIAQSSISIGYTAHLWGTY